MFKALFENALEGFLSIVKSRIFILGIVLFFMFAALINRLFQLQIVEGEDYLNTFTYRIQKNTEISAPRGTIYDKNGEVLAKSVLAYSLTIEDDTILTDNQEKNAMIYKLVGILKAHNTEFTNNVPLRITSSGGIEFTGSEGTIRTFKRNIYAIESNKTLSEDQEAATAEDVYDFMISSDRFNIDSKYTLEESLDIIAIRYELYMKRFMKYLTVTLSTDISDELIAAIKENRADLPGVDIKEDYKREYVDSKYFSHITGYTGQISETELAAFEEEGLDSYKASDIVGKTGVEQLMETELVGEKGSQTVFVNSLGSILDTTDAVAAVNGNDVYLTIEKNLQQTAYDLLEAKIAGIILMKIVDSINEDNNPDHLISYQMIFRALIENNQINVLAFEEDDASDKERGFFSSYENYAEAAMRQLRSYMTESSQPEHNDYSREYRTYFSYIYNYLRAEGILDTSNVDSSEQSTYTLWTYGNVSFGTFLKYMVENGDIFTEKLRLEDEYPDVSQVYDAIIEYIVNNLPNDTGFKRLAYSQMYQNGFISSKDICLLLYEHGTLEKDEAYNELASNVIDAETFIETQIENLVITPDMLALDTCSGAIVVTDVNDGSVLAMVSYPSYDANRISDSGYYYSLLNNESRPLYNRATQQNTAPGSTFKMISAIAGLEEGVINTTETINDTVVFKKVYPEAECWYKQGHGPLNVVGALSHSCNYFFYETGYRLGLTEDNEGKSYYDDQLSVDTLSKYISLFGLDEKSGIELTETAASVTTRDGVRSAIGQSNHNYTAAQIARYVTAVGNKGKVYDLTLLDKVTDAKGEVVEDYENEPIRELSFSSSTWDAVFQGMNAATNDSSKYKDVFTSLKINTAGKSGTAQENSLKPDHGLYVGFAPYENPEIAVTCVMPYSYTSNNVADTFRDVVAYYFDQSLYNAVDGDLKAIKPYTAQYTDVTVGD